MKHRLEPATCGATTDPAALTLQPGWGPPPPGGAYPHGSGYTENMPGYVAPPAKPAVVTPPVVPAAKP